MPTRFPIGSNYDEWVRKLEAKGWNKLSAEEMGWYRTLSAQRESIRQLEVQLRRMEAKAAQPPKPECQIKWCGETSVDGVYCKRCKGNIESWKKMRR